MHAVESQLSSLKTQDFPQDSSLKTQDPPSQTQDTPIQNSSFNVHSSYFPLFPRNRFTLLIGIPGTGKSLLSTYLAARQSLRSPFPPDPFTPNPLPDDTIHPNDHPGMSVICSREDDPQTLDFRLSIAAQGKPADTRFILRPELGSLITPKLKPSEYNRRDDENPIDVSPLLAELKHLARRHGPISLLILDPLPAFLENLDASNNPALIRQAMTPLLDFCSANNTTLVGISHLTKSNRTHHPLFQAASSFAYTALARSVLLLTHDANNPMRRLLIPLKNSFAIPQAAYAFTLHSTAIQDVEIPFPYLTFDPNPIRNHPLLPSSTSPTPAEDTLEASTLELAEHFLKTTLLEGPLPSAQLLSEARSLGISLRTFDRARQNLRAVSFRTSKRWFTHIPSLSAPDYNI